MAGDSPGDVFSPVCPQGSKPVGPVGLPAQSVQTFVYLHKRLASAGITMPQLCLQHISCGREAELAQSAAGGSAPATS